MIACSFVVPEATAIFLPAISAKLRIFDVLLTTTPVLSMKIKFEKSTSFIRLKVTVLEPHSISAFPLATAENRV